MDRFLERQTTQNGHTDPAGDYGPCHMSGTIDMQLSDLRQTRIQGPNMLWCRLFTSSPFGCPSGHMNLERAVGKQFGASRPECLAARVGQSGNVVAGGPEPERERVPPFVEARYPTKTVSAVVRS